VAASPLTRTDGKQAGRAARSGLRVRRTEILSPCRLRAVLRRRRASRKPEQVGLLPSRASSRGPVGTGCAPRTWYGSRGSGRVLSAGTMLSFVARHPRVSAPGQSADPLRPTESRPEKADLQRAVLPTQTGGGGNPPAPDREVAHEEAPQPVDRPLLLRVEPDGALCPDAQGAARAPQGALLDRDGGPLPMRGGSLLRVRFVAEWVAELPARRDGRPRDRAGEAMGRC
jgi:hypothetical protein